MRSTVLLMTFASGAQAQTSARHRSIIARLILKDLQLQRAMIIGAFVVGPAALALMPLGDTGFFVGWVLLLVVLIILGVFTAMVGVIQERRDRVHLFMLSLPVSPAQYTAAKVVANLTAFLVPWAILTGASFVVIAATSIPDGLLPFMPILMLYVVCYYSIFLGLGLVSNSTIWSTVVIVCGNIAPTFFIPALYRLPGAGANGRLPTPLWGPEVARDRCDRGRALRVGARPRAVSPIPSTRSRLRSKLMSSFPLLRGPALLPVLSIAAAVAAVHAQELTAQEDPFVAVYRESCSVCHGENLEGAAQGTPLVGVDLRHGDSIDDIARSIAGGFPETGMPAWSETLNQAEIERLAHYIAEVRAGLAYTDFKIAAPLEIPEGMLESEEHDFRIETVAAGLDPLPFSIAPLPDGRILLTEKTRGLSIISPEGEQSDLVRGTPPAYDDGVEVPGIQLTFGVGWLMDVAPHPDYEENGWIYLHYGDRCTDCNAASRAAGLPVSMNALIRGRIEDGEWVDEESIWRADIETYTPVPDMGAGGRIAFDDDGHVFMSVGIKGAGEEVGIQDLSLPYGKIHRMNDDGSIPADNPFVNVPDALQTIWTYGHRSPQGLELNPRTGQLWGTEMGQRGGDEVNLLLPGRNYGWPVHSKGLKYDGTPVDYGKALGIELGPEDFERPVVDLTPSPAVSSFVFYDGTAFPGWRDDIIVGTLKATELYRLVLRGDRVVHRETLLTDFGRVRDIEVGPGGHIYLLIEHASGGKILRLVPASAGG